jgi:hypothetical protein
VLAEVPDVAVDQGELAGDLLGPPFVQGRAVLGAEGVVVGLAVVDGDDAPPALASVGALGDLLDDPRVVEYPQVVAGGAGVLAQGFCDGGGGSGLVLVQVPQDLLADGNTFLTLGC